MRTTIIDRINVCTTISYRGSCVNPIFISIYTEPKNVNEFMDHYLQILSKLLI
jgi:3-polyprenyl-4-hydroxybenzoate decarboxylase